MKKSFTVPSIVFCLASFLLAQGTPSAPGQTPEKSQGTQPAADASVTGKWKFVLDTEGGDRIYPADLQQDGEKVSGRWANKDEVKGTFSKGKLALEFPADSDEVGKGTLKLTGDLTDSLTGTWSFQTYSGTFKATREKP